MWLTSCPQLDLISLGFHFVLMLAHRESETVCRQTCDEWFISYAMWHSTPSRKRAYVCETNSGCWPHLTSTRLNMRGYKHEGDSPAKKAYGGSNWELIRLIVVSSASLESTANRLLSLLTMLCNRRDGLWGNCLSAFIIIAALLLRIISG